MSVLATFTKQPAEKESYSINYADDLTENDGIKSDGVVVTVSPEGLVIDSFLVVSPRVKVLTSGGIDKTKYKVTVTAETDDGRKLQDEFFVKVKDT